MLQPWTAQAGTCDGCRRGVMRGERVMDCRPCNYYLCEACHPSANKQEEDSTIWTAVSALFDATSHGMSGVAGQLESITSGIPLCRVVDKDDLTADELRVESLP